MSRRSNAKSWDQMSSSERAWILVRKIDRNTRALAKLASACAYLADEGCEVSSEAPALYAAMGSVLGERRVLRESLESELKLVRSTASARQLSRLGR